MTKRRIAILGSVGVPGRYGGFETLADNLVAHHETSSSDHDLTVYCSTKAFDTRPDTYKAARLRYIPLSANGVQSILYDVMSLVDAAWRGHDRVLLLGVSGALFLPLFRLFSRARITTNIDGIEWQRAKWTGLAKLILRLSERAAVRFSHAVIADNAAIADHVADRYGVRCEHISYGGDHAVAVQPDERAISHLPNAYHLATARIEPENNAAMILAAFDKMDQPLVFLGNWDATPLGRALKAEYRNHPTVTLHEPVYDPGTLRAIRDRAITYVHGHSAGGTNPSLVEMMHFGIPIMALDCVFNRETTENKAMYFTDADDLAQITLTMTPEVGARIGKAMGEVARRRYTWDQIGKAYFNLLET